MAKPIDLRIKAIEIVEQGKSVRDVARTCGVSIWTVRRWLKLYEESGLERLFYIPSGNITSDNVTESVYLLKEQNPKITLAQARKKLSSKRIQLSLEGIRKIWRRYGLAGYDKKKQIAEIVPNMPFSQNVKRAIDSAVKILQQNNDINAAAKILNRLPYCGGAEVLDKIPYRYLGLRRRVEKIPYLLGKEPLHKFYKRVHSLRLSLEKSKLFYSSLRVGMEEVNALFWLGRPKQSLSLMKVLAQRCPRQGDPAICFIVTLFKGTALNRLLKLNEAVQCAKRCQRLIKMLPDPSFHLGLGNLYFNIGRYLHAKNYYERAVPNTSGSTRDQVLLSLAGCYALDGEYQKILKILKELEKKRLPAYTPIPLLRAQSLLGKGMLIEAAQYAKTAIEIAKKNEILQYLHISTTVLACIYHALGEKKRARSLIQGTIPLLKKNWMMRDYYIRMLLLGREEIAVPKVYKGEPIKLILLMKKANQTQRLKDYNCALRFAIRKGLKGFFHRLCIFNSEIILKLMEKGKPTGLPKAILGLPVFNKNLPAFHISFLGPLRVYRVEGYLRVKLRPKDTAFLIDLSSAKGFRLSVNDVYQNFWPKSKDAKSNLFHLLWRLRKTLGISSHNLYIKGRYIYFKGFLTTDLQKFEEMITIARAFERTDEWEFARKEYLHAFKLFRDEPFRKMYDQWSEDMRHRTLSQLETETTNFAKRCLEHKDKRDVKRVLEKVLKIIPDSEEMKDMVKSIV
jgi:tetratricopeptide (TPR) repeat protein